MHQIIEGKRVLHTFDDLKLAQEWLSIINTQGRNVYIKSH